MRKLIVHEFVSLDGVMQAPGAKDEDRDGGVEHGGWTMPDWRAGRVACDAHVLPKVRNRTYA